MPYGITQQGFSADSVCASPMCRKTGTRFHVLEGDPPPSLMKALQQMVDAARLLERDAIVAWLRHATCPQGAFDLAGRIATGEHLEEGSS
jgi:hypothetical protein